MNHQKLELIDWSERYPQENAFTIAVRQSTYCLCGARKEIGDLECAACVVEPRTINDFPALKS